MTSALITDFYELTMMQGYFLKKHNPKVVFDVFYRTNPFSGGYTVFTGLEEVIDKLENFAFSPEDIQYLRSLDTFDEGFLEYLSSYRFSGNIYAFDEGTTAFPGEPLVRVESSLMDAQLIESFILNTLNFQTLIATKAMRMTYATRGKGAIMEFGLRRAQGENGAHAASRASFTKVTSNTYAGKKYGIPVSGTMAHSWIMSFDSEEEAFREFAAIYPDNAVLLIDTYDTLGSGIDAAIKIGLEQKAKGKKIGVRIDSGDLSYLPRVIRDRLDKAGLEDATICHHMHFKRPHGRDHINTCHRRSSDRQLGNRNPSYNRRKPGISERCIQACSQGGERRIRPHPQAVKQLGENNKPGHQAGIPFL